LHKGKSASANFIFRLNDKLGNEVYIGLTARQKAIWHTAVEVWSLERLQKES